MHDWLHRAESFFWSWQFLVYSRNYVHCMVNRRFLTMFTSPNCFYPARSMQSTPPSDLFKMNFNIILPHILKPSKLPFPFKFSHQPSPQFHTLTLVILLDFITQIKFTRAYRSWRPSLCNFRQFPVASYFSGRNVVRSTLVLSALSLWSICLCVQSTQKANCSLCDVWSSLDCFRAVQILL